MRIHADVESMKKEILVNQNYIKSIKSELSSMKETLKLILRLVIVHHSSSQKAVSQEGEEERDDNTKYNLLDAVYIGHDKRLRKLAKQVRSPYIVNTKMLAKLKITIPTNTFNPMRPVPTVVASALEIYIRLENPRIEEFHY
ncbi:hypothetical protein FNV43_RR11129 [Rhamnella rubrinervis]|uniref:Uncharacterized protein n=1 Tax=Rhamnella rubrinervis TaxID=2594499 RepID=A0A8K0H508_9ROSA|nr:hypothetical protein FNV43_RR11129 [Rhamnella rubrinervis]